MLHTKFRVNRPAGSGEEDFEWFLPYIVIYSHLCHVTGIMSSDFHFLLPESLHTK